MTDFQKAVADYLAADVENCTRLAGAFGVALSTIQRWVKGVSRPHPRLQALIVDWIKGIR